MVKKIFLFLMFLFFGINGVFADEYALFYGNGCSHCAKVEKYLENTKLLKNIDLKEIYYDKINQNFFRKVIEKLKIDDKEAGVPLLLIKNKNEELSYKIGDKQIINYIDKNNGKIKKSEKYNFDIFELVEEKEFKINDFWKFLLIMIPAAISDSINPCAFAVILILLGSILTKYKNKKKIYLAGFLFSLSIFISYLLMGIGVYVAFASTGSTILLKVIIGIIGIIVGLANLKDFFWYGKGFRMEVPISWRPKLKQFLNSVTNPMGAFFIGFIVSLFLLPCTSGPYITILGYLASESKEITGLGYLYLIIYNLIFVLPMFLITIIVGNGTYKIEHLIKQKEKYTKIIHLIVGLLMLGLGIYVIIDSGIIL